MFKITKVTSQKKNPRRFNIFIDGEFAFGADEDLVVNQRLVVGKILASEDMKKILFEAEVGKLMEPMYRWFSLRQHSEKEVRDYFKTKNWKLKIKKKEPISNLVVEALIENLKKKNIINDLEFARVWIDARRRKQKGIRAIKIELFQKGISKEIIEEIISNQALVVKEEELAQKALEKKVRVWKNLEPQKFKKKAYDFLRRRGFEYDVIKEVVEKTTKLM
ncbi:RecX family transcriptional regulator [Patescibacteria group bacterium]|nr:RecX family transcriptional regulator [Patescibacteria group bacterium]